MTDLIELWTRISWRTRSPVASTRRAAGSAQRRRPCAPAPSAATSSAPARYCSATEFISASIGALGDHGVGRQVPDPPHRPAEDDVADDEHRCEARLDDGEHDGAGDGEQGDADDTRATTDDRKTVSDGDVGVAAGEQFARRAVAVEGQVGLEHVAGELVAQPVGDPPGELGRPPGDDHAQTAPDQTDTGEAEPERRDVGERRRRRRSARRTGRATAIPRWAARWRSRA